MMVFFFFVTIAASFQIFMLIWIVFYIVDAETSEKLEKTLNEEAEENMQALVQQGAIYVESLLVSIGTMFNFISGVIVEMEFEETYSLNYEKVYDEYTGPEYCSTDENEISLECEYYTMIEPFNFNSTWLIKLSRLESYWKPIFGLTNELALRYMIYLEEDGFYLVYPGMKTDVWKEYFSLKNLFETLVYGGEKMRVRLPEYKDIYNETKNVVTLYQPLYNIDLDLIGLISADLISETLFKNISDMRYLENGGDIALIYKDGQIIRYGDIKGNDFELIQDYTSPEFWAQIQKNPYGTYTNIVNGTINRISTAPVYLGDGENTYWFILMLIQSEEEILKYKREAKDYISNSMYFNFLITLGSSLLTILIVILVTNSVSKKITKPIKGIINFSKKISESSYRKVVQEQELEELEEGQGQVSELIQAYKSMAKGLIWKPNTNTQNFPLKVLNTDLYPPNELWQTDRLNWLEDIQKKLPEDS